MREANTSPRPCYRSVFVSDVHLGHKASQTAQLLQFLRQCDFEYPFLLGDIIDCQTVARTGHWPHHHGRVLVEFRRLARAGVQVIYIPGNHDSEYRNWCGTTLRGIHLHRQYRHRLASGRDMLLMHGDELDTRIPTAPALRWFGHHGAEFLLHFNHWVNRASRLTGGSYRQASNALKIRIGWITRHIEAYTQQALGFARESACDGVITGHIHFPALSQQGRLVYANCGDWVESCTALVETPDGELQLLHAGRVQARLARPGIPELRPAAA